MERDLNCREHEGEIKTDSNETDKSTRGQSKTDKNENEESTNCDERKNRREQESHRQRKEASLEHYQDLDDEEGSRPCCN